MVKLFWKLDFNICTDLACKNHIEFHALRMVELFWELDFNNYNEFRIHKWDRVPMRLSMVKLFWELDFNNYTEFSM